MISNKSFFNNSKVLPIDQFIENVLYNKKVGYYSSKIPFGKKGDFLTAPGISNLFSEIIGIWLISTWYTLGRPKNFNIVELGPGDGSLTKILLKIFQKFSAFNQATNIFLYEKHYLLNKKNKIDEIYKKASGKYVSQIKRFKSLKNLKFIEFPKLGFDELNKIIKKLSKFEGGLLLIDYGYLTPKNKNTLQSLIKHKRNNLLDNLGKADITSLVNFKLLNEYFTKNYLKVKKVVTQKFFLEKMGIIERANNLSEKMSFKEQSNLYLRLKRLLDTKLMGNLFKVIFAYKSNKDNFLGFE